MKIVGFNKKIVTQNKNYVFYLLKMTEKHERKKNPDIPYKR